MTPLLLIALAAAAPQSRPETRCGWLDNSTPANWLLTDRDGEWLIGSQGGYQAPGLDESCACNRCPYMRLNTLEKLYLCLANDGPQVRVPEELARQARAPIELMLSLS